MWQRYLEKALELGGDAEFVAVHTSADGVDDGFVHYQVKWVEERSTPPRGTGEVYDLWGATPAVELALWDYLCNVDLVDEWYAEERPVDDVIQFAVADTRAYRTKWLVDEQWLRLLDVDAALDGAAVRRRRRRRDDRRQRPAADRTTPGCGASRLAAPSASVTRPTPTSPSTSVSCRRPTSAERRGARSSPPAASTYATGGGRPRRRPVRRPRGAVLLQPASDGPSIGGDVRGRSPDANGITATNVGQRVGRRWRSERIGRSVAATDIPPDDGRRLGAHPGGHR